MQWIHPCSLVLKAFSSLGSTFWDPDPPGSTPDPPLDPPLSMRSETNKKGRKLGRFRKGKGKEKERKEKGKGRKGFRGRKLGRFRKGKGKESKGKERRRKGFRV